MENKVISFEVYEDNGGFVRCYMIQGDKVRGFDEWERFGFGDLRRCLYNAFANRFDRIVDSFDGAEFDNDVKTALADDRDRSDLIVTAAVNDVGGAYADVYENRMGPAGCHAWGIKEDK